MADLKVQEEYRETYRKIVNGTEPNDFETLRLKHPDCGEFETYWDWYLYFLQELQTMGWAAESCNTYLGSPWRFIAQKAEEVREDIANA